MEVLDSALKDFEKIVDDDKKCIKSERAVPLPGLNFV